MLSLIFAENLGGVKINYQLTAREMKRVAYQFFGRSLYPGLYFDYYYNRDADIISADSYKNRKHIDIISFGPPRLKFK